MSPEDRDRLVTALEEFDYSDAYHDGERYGESYYAAIDRAIRLVKGDINTWTDPKPVKEDDK